MVIDSLVITFIGMTAVFIFLLLMIVMMNCLRLVVPWLDKISPESRPAALKPRAVSAGAAAAAAVALAYYSAGRSKQQ